MTTLFDMKSSRSMTAIQVNCCLYVIRAYVSYDILVHWTKKAGCALRGAPLSIVLDRMLIASVLHMLYFDMEVLEVVPVDIHDSSEDDGQVAEYRWDKAKQIVMEQAAVLFKGELADYHSPDCRPQMLLGKGGDVVLDQTIKFKMRGKLHEIDLRIVDTGAEVQIMSRLVKENNEGVETTNRLAGDLKKVIAGHWRQYVARSRPIEGK